MNDSQIKILNKINQGLKHGDKKILARKAKRSQDFVGRVLNPFNPAYDEAVVKEAVKILKFREKETRNLLQELEVSVQS